MGIKIISAGAGSGKTYRLTSELVELLRGPIRAGGIIATTYTNKAASELEERVRVHLLQQGMMKEASELSNAIIGTVHSMGIRLLKRFAFEAGLSPDIEAISDDDQQTLFNKSLATVLNPEKISLMNQLSEMVGLAKRQEADWRKPLKEIIDIARSNNLTLETLERSKIYSFETLKNFLAPPSEDQAEIWEKNLKKLLQQTNTALNEGTDATNATVGVKSAISSLLQKMEAGHPIPWHEWAKLSKLNPGAKSREKVNELKEFARNHDSNPAFHNDVKNYIYQLFDLASEAIKEFDDYKKKHGLIDYIDMETQVDKLLDHEKVRTILREEIDLLLVDEFQDTSPIQLSIFFKLSQIARESIWVGDPKQSIYGFRGADPRLMKAIIDASGGIKPENIQIYSWRSRKDIVHLTNALFTKAFDKLPPEQVYLREQPASRPLATGENYAEPANAEPAIIQWHFQCENEKKTPGGVWPNKSLAAAVKSLIEEQPPVYDKHAKIWRPAQPGDIAILCRTNDHCTTLAEQLHAAGIRSSLSRKGLLSTREARLLLACLRLILTSQDTLAVAEINRLTTGKPLQEIILNRLNFLQQDSTENNNFWDGDNPFVRKIKALQKQVIDLSSSEIIDLIMEEPGLKQILLQWGASRQRHDNLDSIRYLASQYEEGTNRLHTGASLGGFLLWLNNLQKNNNDKQSAGDSADAVNILTYHKSKGLEWPITICYDLNSKLKDTLFGPFLVDETDHIDLNNILGNRLLRYWINPYADQIKKTNLEKNLETSVEKLVATTFAQEEENRLLYVGITRARDYLIIPTREGHKTSWLNRVANDGVEETEILEPKKVETPWTWEGNPILKKTISLVFGKEFPAVQLQEKQAFFFEPSNAKRESWPPFKINLQKEGPSIQMLFPLPEFKTTTYFKPEPLTPSIELDNWGRCLRAFLLSDSPTIEPTLRLETAQKLCIHHQLPLDELPLRMIQQADAFFREIAVKNVKVPEHRNFPVQYLFQERLFETVVDYLSTQQDEIVFIQHIIDPQDPSTALTNVSVEKWAPWTFLTAKGLQEATRIKRIRPLLHFILQNQLIEKPPINRWV